MKNKTIVLYDGNCPMCSFQMQLLTWVDFLHHLHLIPYKNSAAEQYTQNIDPEALQASIHCVDGTGKVYRGAYALRHICLRLPTYLPLAILLYLPGIMYVANEIYNGVSRNRMRLSRIFGCSTACKIMPTKARSGDIRGDV
ncbi:MAG: DUF393 domain-containing protein, partial [Planctomycetes bacterium]|nr:DUF393 domain-containing protein [Planctomycetota bacterium]